MLKIDIPKGSALITRDMFDEYSIPLPPNGMDTEINEDLILLFDDEQQAVTYLDELEDYAGELDEESPEKDILNALITAIGNDDFVTTFLEENE